jgi:hypothetical protein
VNAPKCRIHSNSTFRLGNYTFFGLLKSGKGVISAVDSDGQVCSFSSQKELAYESWRFSLSLLLGVSAMYIGFQTMQGWNRAAMKRPARIAAANPRAQYESGDGFGKSSDQIDEFDSDDGY